MPKDMTRVKKFTGVYYRESEDKRFNGAPDKCFYINFLQPGKKSTKWEKVGWMSEGYTAVLASTVRAERIRQMRHGEEIPSERKHKDPTFGEVWENYDSWLKTNKSTPRHDRCTYETHLKPRFKDLKLSEIKPLHLEKMKEELTDSGLASSTVKHCLVLFRQVVNKAITWGVWDGLNPVKKVKMPKLNNERQRFLTVDEANLLLNELKIACPVTMRIALISLHTGLRVGEVFKLRWQDIDVPNGVINVQGKSGGNEKVYMTDTVKMVFSNSGGMNDYVFPTKSGEQKRWVSTCFSRTVSELGLNDGVKSSLHKVTFHTLRHTFASWLALRGTPILTIKDLMRHKDIRMTLRYAHLIPDHRRDAINGIEETFHGSPKSEPTSS